MVIVSARIPAGNAARSETDPLCARKMRSQNCIIVNEAIVTMIGADTRPISRYPPGLGGSPFRMDALLKMALLRVARRQRAGGSCFPWLDR